jgi:hypothetical protein
MRQTGGSLWVLFLWASLCRAEADAAGKVVLDNWDSAYIEGTHIGYFHTTVRLTEKDGAKSYRTTLVMNLTIKRNEEVKGLRMENGTEETEDGQVTGVFMKQFQANKQTVELTGTIEDGRLKYRIEQDNVKVVDKTVKWNDDAIGLYRQERLFQLKKVKPGDEFRFLSYEPTLNSPVNVKVVVKEEEEVELLGGKKKRLLRVETTPDKVEAQGVSVELPMMIVWLDKDRLPVRSQLDMPGLGKVLLYRTTKEIAQARIDTTVKLPDLGRAALVPLNKRISNPFDASLVVYKITLKDDEKAATAFAADERQEIKNAKGNTIELHVHAAREPSKGDPDAKAGEEFLESSFYVDGTDSEVKALARRAVGEQKDPWKKAKLIERWVYENMHNSNTADFGTAGQVARALEGDCRQHAMLTAGMCRTAGVPSRTALGLVYVNDPQKGPNMGFHMWTEVWIKGQWMGIDATLGRGGIGVGHVKISDASWHDVHDLKPLLPVTKVLGKVTMEIVRVEEAK